ncbi:SixA phosphatase family protein [Aliidiomarina sp. Khilg15.8]
MLQRLLMASVLVVSMALPAAAQQEESSEVETELEQEVMNATEADTTASDDDGVTGPYTLYIVRHAEKREGDLDPALTDDGYQRAQGLSQILQHTGVEAIYSTYYRRTTGTALPLARELGIPVQFYQADDEDALIEMLHEQGQTALVVGHSNTVPSLVRALGGDADDMSESQFGDLFQITLDGDDVTTTRLVAPLVKKN